MNTVFGKMTKKSALAKRREEMFDFLESNIVAKNINPEKNILHFVDHKNQAYQIITISSEKELKNLIEFKHQNDSTTLDNDREELKGMLEKIINYITKVNEETDEIPGFVFLQSETDFKQSNIDERVDKLVNKIGFNKQQIGNNYFKRPFYDIRKFNQAELVLWALHQKTIGENRTKPRYIKYKGFYLPELAQYNPNKKILEVSDYKHVFSPDEFKQVYRCPVCVAPEGPDHSECKKDIEYTKYVMRRNKARYLKHIFINKERRDKVLGSKSKESGVRFKPVELERSFLEKYTSKKLKQDKYYISLVK